MAVNRDSPNRRRSIAVTNQSKPTIIPRSKRRPHSIVPGDRLSPFAKARRSLAPRKSILKASIHILNTDISPPNSQVFSQPQQSQSQSQGSTQSSLRDENATQSMDITYDFHAKVHDNTSRKSFGGRRVSFAEHAQVRLFEKPDKDHTNSTDSPQSSPAQASPNDENVRPQHVSDENAYPGASRQRRRSSARYSMGTQGEDMDLTSIGPTAFMMPSGSAIVDGEYDDEFDDDEDDMDVTDVIHGDFIRKRSLSTGMSRRPLSQLEGGEDAVHPSSDNDQDQSHSYTDGESMSQSEGEPDQSRAMEFTIPLNQSLRPPAHHDEAWLALRQATHSGDTPYEPEPSSDDDHRHVGGDGMDLDDAMERLLRARSSLSQPSQSQGSTEEMAYLAQQGEIQEDSFNSTEDSLDNDYGDQTVNMSKVMGRVSLGGASIGRMSMGGYQDETMEESEIYGSIVPPVQSTPCHSQAHAQPIPEPVPAPAPIHEEPPELLQPQLTVFQPPPSQAKLPVPTSTNQPRPSTSQRATPKSTILVPFSFTPKAPTSAPPPKPAQARPASPSKNKTKPPLSAAFAPPTVRPSPKKASHAKTSPNKRPRPEHDSDIENGDIDKPSPAKRQAMAGKWPAGSAAPADQGPASATKQTIVTSKPKPLSPSKKALFEVTPANSAAPAVPRPSGYFARRKSMATGLGGAKVVSVEEPVANTAAATARKSPKKKAGLGLGRASMGSAPADAYKRFDKTATVPIIPSDKGKGKDKEVDTSSKAKEADKCVREAARQAVAAPSPTRGSPAPASPRTRSPALASEAGPSSHAPQALDLSGFLETDDTEDGRDHNMDVDATQHWREGVEEYDTATQDFPSISVEQFFAMTGIKFMDELTAPRRSMHPSHQPPRQARGSEDIPLAEYVTAMAIDIPQLGLYTRVSKDLQAWMEQSKAVFAQAEDEAAKITPELFIEYSRADEEGQAELLHQLNLIRTNTRGLAKSDWYDWKLQWVEGLRVTAEKAFAALEQDALKLEKIKSTADEVIPSLQQQYDEIMLELEKEKAEVADIEQCDQDYLNELKASIAEQNVEVEALQAELAEGDAQLRWLEERLQEVEAQKREASTAIADSQRVLHIQKNSTRAEVFRLKDELEALEDLHMFRTTKVSANHFEYVYASLFRITIPCAKFLPIVSRVDISRVDKTRSKIKDDFPRLSDFLLSAARRMIVEGEDLTVRQIVHRLADYWSSCTQLRSQLTLLSIKYPVEFEFDDQPSISASSFRAKAKVMFPAAKAKAFISFIFPTYIFSRWPVSIDSLDCEVHVAYGPLDRGAIIKAVTDRLSEATAADNYACLLDACIEAQDVYQLADSPLRS